MKITTKRFITWSNKYSHYSKLRIPFPIQKYW